MRNALGLMLASVVAAVVIAAVFGFGLFAARRSAAPPRQLPPARPSPCRHRRSRRQGRRRDHGGDCRQAAACRAAPAPAPMPVQQKSTCANPERARRQPRGRDRHHGRTRLRLRAFQAVRLPHRQGSRADLRRRSVAGQHARRAEGAGGRMHQGRVLLDRQARDLSSGNPPPGAAPPATRSARTPGRTSISTARR